MWQFIFFHAPAQDIEPESWANGDLRKLCDSGRKPLRLDGKMTVDMLKILKNPKQCSRGDPTKMGADMWDAVGQPSLKQEREKISQALYNPRARFTILPFCYFTPCSFLVLFPLPVVTLTVDVVAIACYCWLLFLSLFRYKFVSWGALFMVLQFLVLSFQSFFLSLFSAMHTYIWMNTCWCHFIIFSVLYDPLPTSNLASRSRWSTRLSGRCPERSPPQTEAEMQSWRPQQRRLCSESNSLRKNRLHKFPQSKQPRVIKLISRKISINNSSSVKSPKSCKHL